MMISQILAVRFKHLRGIKVQRFCRYLQVRDVDQQPDLSGKQIHHFTTLLGITHKKRIRREFYCVLCREHIIFNHQFNPGTNRPFQPDVRYDSQRLQYMHRDQKDFGSVSAFPGRQPEDQARSQHEHCTCLHQELRTTGAIVQREQRSAPPPLRLTNLNSGQRAQPVAESNCEFGSEYPRQCLQIAQQVRRIIASREFDTIRTDVDQLCAGDCRGFALKSSR